MLEAVVGHAHQPDAERDGWVPTPVDDPVEVVRGEVAEHGAGPLVDRGEVVEQDLGGRPDGVDLLSRVAVAGVARLGVEAELRTVR